MRFGGLVAVDGVSLSAPAGRVTGLIGPNGAGKTTTFNACTGLLKPTAGRVSITGVDVSRRGPSARARKGLGRTFQKMELFESLTVRENVEAGAEGVLAGSNPITQLAAQGRPSAPGLRAAAEKRGMALVRPSPSSPTGPSPPSTGQRRCRTRPPAWRGRSGLLLLDEPSSGPDRAETGALRPRSPPAGRGRARRRDPARGARHVARTRTSSPARLRARLPGELVFQGSPEEIVASLVVRAAYLGDSEVEAAVEAGHTIEEVAS